MPEEATIKEITERLDQFSKFFVWVKLVVAGAFMLGVWTASIQFTINAVLAEQDTIKSDLKASAEHAQQQREDITELKTILKGIAERQAEMVVDIKEMVRRK